MSFGFGKCEVCGSTLALDIGFGNAANWRTKDNKRACSERCCRDYNLNLLHSGGGSSGNVGNSSGSSTGGKISSFLSESMKSDEEKMAEQGLSGAEIAEIQRQKAAADLEFAKHRAEVEEKEANQRKIKADVYRQQGRPLIAWLVELNPIYSLSILGAPLILCLGPGAIKIVGIIATIVMILLIVKDAAKLSWKLIGIVIVGLIAGIIGLILFNQHKNSLEEAASAADMNKISQHADSVSKTGNELNLKLEGIEDQVKLAITDGNREKALALANQLIHPMHEQWKNESKFDRAKGYPYFDEYWSQKRQEYKDKIIAMPNNAVPVQVNQAQTDTATIKQDTTKKN